MELTAEGLRRTAFRESTGGVGAFATESRSPACGLTMHDALDLESDTVLTAETSASSVSMLPSTCNFTFGFRLEPSPPPKLWVLTATLALYQLSPLSGVDSEQC